MYKYPKIKSLADVHSYVTRGLVEQPKYRDVTYTGTVKLHGTNCAVACGDELVPQSRNRVLSLESDNYGFAAFVNQYHDDVRKVERAIRTLRTCDTLVIYGEFIGPGIQQGVAISKLKERQWVTFAAAAITGDEVHWLNINNAAINSGPVSTVYELEVYKLRIVDFQSPDAVSDALTASRVLVDNIEEQCPWAAQYGIEGTGEGIVWVPEDVVFRNDTDLWWKHKGDKHAKVKKRVEVVDTEGHREAELLALTCLDGRLDQGIKYLEEMEYPLSVQSIPEFLKRVGGEVKEECAIAIEEAGFTWKSLAGTVNRKAVAWYKARIGA